MYRITSEGTYAFNRITRERMDKPKWPDYREYAHDSDWYPAYYRYVSAMKVWDAFVKALPDDHAYKRPTLTHATEKGVPVPNIRSGGRRKYVNGSGVSASSRVLSHYYADEGDKGRWVRKLVRNRERALWLSEWEAEQNEDAEYGYARDAYSAGEWFDDNPYTWDWYYGEDDYDSEDYYPRAWDDLWDYCDHCGGPCEL